MEKIKILGISGSLRQGSFNTAALRATASLLPADAELEVFTLQNIPPLNTDLENDLPAGVKDLKARIRAADAVLICSPEYNHSISGVMKNAIDWATRPEGDNAFSAKPGAIMGVSNGNFGTARMYYDLHKVMADVNVLLLNHPQVLIANGQKKFDAEGKLIDQELAEKLKAFASALIEWTRKLKAAGLAK